MFLCIDECAKKHGVSEFRLIVGPFSYGPCEDCKRTRTCVDWIDYKREKAEDAKQDD